MTGFQYAMLGIGALALLCGVLVLALRVRTILQGRVVDAVVVGDKVEHVHSQQDDTMTPVSRPVFEFRHDGKTMRGQSSLAQRDSLRKGAKVRVRYLPSDPEGTAEIDSAGAMWGFPAVALFVGAVLVAVGLYDAGYFRR